MAKNFIVLLHREPNKKAVIVGLNFTIKITVIVGFNRTRSTTKVGYLLLLTK